MIRLNKIRNIIFDLGGVILQIDYGLTSLAFRALGATDFDRIYSQAQQSSLFDDLEKGLIAPEAFCRQVREYFRADWSDAQICHAWNAMLIGLPAERLELLARLRKKYRLFLLSNTNAIHLDGCRKIFQQATGRNNLLHIFEKEYYSHLIGMRKPDREVFELILKENRLRGEETLFIDDSEQHVEGAVSAGIRGHHLKPGQTLLELLSL